MTLWTETGGVEERLGALGLTADDAERLTSSEVDDDPAFLAWTVFEGCGVTGVRQLGDAGEDIGEVPLRHEQYRELSNGMDLGEKRMNFFDRHQLVSACGPPRTDRTGHPHAMAIALICAFCATPFQAAAQEIVINHYTHRGCGTGSGERLLPIYALQGDIARVPEGSHWDCERVINSAALSCEWAVEAPQDRQNEQHPECLAIFAAEVPDCLAHYDNERGKCTASTGAVGLDASERRRVQEALAAVGFDPGPADGVFGPKTRRAIQAWQQAKGYATTGELTTEQTATLLRGAHAPEPFGPNWIITENQPCQLYNPNPEPEETVTWSGACVDGKAHGRGTETWANGDRYEGEYRDGERYGRGTETWANGGRYEGEYRDGEKHGYGTFTWPNGNRYEGEYRNDKKHGRGAETWAEGHRYEGEFRDGEIRGRGTYTWANGSRYEGEYRDLKPNGFGIFTGIDGTHYKGQWRDGCSGRDSKFLVWLHTTRAACGF